MKVLVIGEVVGKLGRQAVAQKLPELKEQHQPDLILTNAENSAHGLGMTEKTIAALLESGVNFITSGNHFANRRDILGRMDDPTFPVIRPANYPPGTPGRGFARVEVGARQVLIINLMGRVFIKEDFEDPFRIVDAILEQEIPQEGVDVNTDTDPATIPPVIIDFHAEATSEKVAFKHHLDGRAALIIGSHTHVPTADAQITEKGTAYISDIGMVGPHDSVIGMQKQIVLESFRTQIQPPFEVEEEGPVEFNAILVDIDPKTRRATNIEQIREIFELDT
jgi:metallophosphoesterase (TIGR00282 family)